MVPGEYEAKHRAARLEAGIELEPTVWNDLSACAQSLDVALPQPRDAS